MIDDEKRQMDSYRLDLEFRGFEVRFVSDVDEVVRMLGRGGDVPELAILDLMMPPGAAFAAADTESGLRTGIRLFEALRERWPKLPVMILTNVTDPDVEGQFQGQPCCWFDHKEDYLPKEYSARVKGVLEEMAQGV
jgi:CheY-like chemotaxis protein